MSDPVEFSHKYDREHAGAYGSKHADGFCRTLSLKRDEQLARRALRIAGEPSLVLDLPCGAGRFWPLLAERQNRVIIGADNSADLLQLALRRQPEAIARRVQTLRTSAFAIELPDNSVDSIFCMRLLHQIGSPANRRTMLRECQRVTRDSLIVSLWVDGNYKSWRRKRLERQRPLREGDTGLPNRFVVPAQTVEEEFADLGFSIQGRLDFLPLYAMWRVYVLRKDLPG
jgi:ubiquinone/menaquinone biosynthesis C-methylase UbiE